MKKQEEIIPKIDKDILEQELTEELFVRKTNKAGNEIYIFSYDQAPNLFKEVGRLRELTFRDAGGGTGKSIDIDKYDTAKVPFKQLIVWDPDGKNIIGGYRFLLGKDDGKDENGKPVTPTSKLFKFSQEFIDKYWDKTIELGRSFVQPAYQPSINRKGIFSLDNLWDGLGTLVVNNPDMKYFFGKFTMYPDFPQLGRDLICYFLNRYFPDPDQLVTPLFPVEIKTPKKILEKYFTFDSFQDDYKKLVRSLREMGENIPPLVNAYMNLSSTMKIFGSSHNFYFGDVFETGMLITIDDIKEEKSKRYIESYRKMKAGN
ncbi:MAG TPA: GNAT family N-acetyltransferase [Bacteroidetes bacterium]|nr:GNAT family N-acetyltransferase [Bacteroidota bacterium]